MRKAAKIKRNSEWSQDIFHLISTEVRSQLTASFFIFCCQQKENKNLQVAMGKRSDHDARWTRDWWVEMRSGCDNNSFVLPSAGRLWRQHRWKWQVENRHFGASAKRSMSRMHCIWSGTVNLASAAKFPSHSFHFQATNTHTFFPRTNQKFVEEKPRESAFLVTCSESIWLETLYLFGPHLVRHPRQSTEPGVSSVERHHGNVTPHALDRFSTARI